MEVPEKKRKGILFEKEWFKFYPSNVCQVSSEALPFSAEVAKMNFKPWIINHIMLSSTQYWCLFPRRPKVYLLVNAPVHTSYRQINPKWDSAEVALDFWLNSQHRVFLSILIPINFAERAIDLISMSGSGSVHFCQVNIESEVSEEHPKVSSYCRSVNNPEVHVL